MRAWTILQSVMTDKARYSPGERVQFTLKLGESPVAASLHVSYFHLNTQTDSQTVAAGSNAVTWVWQPPLADYAGYLAEIRLQNGSSARDTAWIAVDVSSDWKKFPRYGFLSKYSCSDASSIEGIISRLNRYHVNGLQFYDWHYKHHLPLKGTPQNPAATWNDIANRTNCFSSVSGFVKAAHDRNMTAMSYNLLYGAYADASSDGVPDEWRLFKDPGHSRPDCHDLPESWASDLYLIDPSNPGWIGHIIGKTRDALRAFGFDGWHIDQLGDRGTLYRYDGGEAPLPDAYLPFLREAKRSLNASLVMNAVNQYGQEAIAAGPVDFLYTEVWPPNERYDALHSLIRQNHAWSNGTLATVLAAYVNRPRSGQAGFFNMPGVLLTDAVIFASGGSHLELGEHMLANEYFPNDHLQMTDELQDRLEAYYDFLTAYQNLLRGGGDFTVGALQSEGIISIQNSPQKGSLWSFSRAVEDRQVFHLINFQNANSLNWRDENGDQPEPKLIWDIPVFFLSPKRVQSLWLASPDAEGGKSRSVTFEQRGDTVRFTVPALKYWDMIVSEYGPSSGDGSLGPVLPQEILFVANYPNPFNGMTRIEFGLGKPAAVELSIFDAAGRKIATIADQRYGAGNHSMIWNPDRRLSSAVYYAVLRTNGKESLARKMMILK